MSLEQRVDELEDGRGQQVAPVPAAQQQARREPAQLRRPVLEDERHAGGPFAAHAEAEQRAQREQHRVRRREAAEAAKIENQRTDSISGSLRPHLSASVPAIVPPTSRMTSVTVPERAGQRAVDREALLDVDEDEGEDVEVERVDDPPEEHRPEGAPLIAR